MTSKLLIVFAISLFSCRQEAVEEKRTTNVNIKVELLFEVDGCRVYRFYDSRYVYFTNCKGGVSWQQGYSNGKQTTVIDHYVPTE